MAETVRRGQHPSTETELAASPMHNPFGRVKLVSMQDIGEAN